MATTDTGDSTTLYRSPDEVFTTMAAVRKTDRYLSTGELKRRVKESDGALYRTEGVPDDALGSNADGYTYYLYVPRPSWTDDARARPLVIVYTQTEADGDVVGTVVTQMCRKSSMANFETAEAYERIN